MTADILERLIVAGRCISLIPKSSLVQTRMLIAIHHVPSWKKGQAPINPWISHFDLETTPRSDAGSIIVIMLNLSVCYWIACSQHVPFSKRISRVGGQLWLALIRITRERMNRLPRLCDVMLGTHTQHRHPQYVRTTGGHSSPSDTSLLCATVAFERCCYKPPANAICTSGAIV